jgi:hypothetical protein
MLCHRSFDQHHGSSISRRKSLISRRKSLDKDHGSLVIGHTYFDEDQGRGEYLSKKVGVFKKVCQGLKILCFEPHRERRECPLNKKKDP